MNPEQIKVAAFNNDQFEFEKDEKGRFIKDKFGLNATDKIDIDINVRLPVKSKKCSVWFK